MFCVIFCVFCMFGVVGFFGKFVSGLIILDVLVELGVLGVVLCGCCIFLFFFEGRNMDCVLFVMGNLVVGGDVGI